MLTLPSLATQASIVVDSEPVTAKASVAPPAASASNASTLTTRSSFVLIQSPLSLCRVASLPAESDARGPSTHADRCRVKQEDGPAARIGSIRAGTALT